jgi:DNA ligase-1
MQTLYKRDTKGNLRYLKIWTQNQTLFQESGIIDTVSPVTHQKDCKGKNKGRSNETTPSEQAILEMNSKIKDKLTEGYFETQAEASTELVVLPMLAKDYKENKSKVKWINVWGQPKLDGMRCLAYKLNNEIILKSRDGKMIENMDHIKLALKDLHDGFILDGELYSHGLSFQENMKLIKKYRPGETEKISYHVYDNVQNKEFSFRYLDLFTCFEAKDPIKIVKTVQLANEDDLKTFHEQNLKEGYEGSMLRHSDSEYKMNGRSASLLKYKDFMDICLPILDVEPCDSRPTWGTPIFKWDKAEGGILKAGTKINHEEREDLLTNKQNYIGKMAELRFFEYSDTGVPRFPVYLGIREDKEVPDTQEVILDFFELKV